MSSFKYPQEIGAYKLNRPLGNGRSSMLALYDLQSPQKTFFVKIFSKSKFENQQILVLFMEKVRALKQISHPNIVTYEAVVEDTEHIYLVSKFCPRGNIGDFVLSHGAFTESISRSIFKQLLSAVKYLHSQGFAHRDIKPENILLDENLNVSLTDFDYSSYVNSESRETTVCGTFLFAAPEVSQCKDYDLIAADIWSLGVILYSLAVGKLPWIPNIEISVEDQIKNAQLPRLSILSSDLASILREIIDADPKTRITYEGIISHPWINVLKRSSLSSESDPILLSPKPPIIPMNEKSAIPPLPTPSLVLTLPHKSKKRTSLGIRRSIPTFM